MRILSFTALIVSTAASRSPSHNGGNPRGCVLGSQANRPKRSTDGGPLDFPAACGAVTSATSAATSVMVSAALSAAGHTIDVICRKFIGRLFETTVEGFITATAMLISAARRSIVALPRLATTAVLGFFCAARGAYRGAYEYLLAALIVAETCEDENGRDNGRNKTKYVLSRSAQNVAFATTSYSTIASILSNEGDKIKMTPDLTSLASQYFAMSVFPLRTLFAIGACLRGLQITTSLRHVFNPSVGCAALVNIACTRLGGDCRWIPRMVVGWTTTPW
eukprot:CAMPEP_0194289060 /NCGR_PEP_ID=MMETSP0169-20130528/38264_1 /TAXON_ID=218684 /ORGANISM="Corethron pennatum, Strain L29A3" /LENGTH=277 /DNA_ID=CAMNT_0039036243 /DNA_START=38 /DNA_END=868 /DNA_ORIENTATION=+